MMCRVTVIILLASLVETPALALNDLLFDLVARSARSFWLPLPSSLLTLPHSLQDGPASSHVRRLGVINKLHQTAPPLYLPRQSALPVQVPGDGACLFHSLALGLQVLGLQGETGMSVRNRIADFISKNPDYLIAGTKLQDWIQWDSRQTVQEYASTLRRGDRWGGAIEMSVFSHIWRVNVGVYELSVGGFGWRRISDFSAEKKHPTQGPQGTVLIQYSRRNHYDALVSTALYQQPQQAAPAAAESFAQISPNIISLTVLIILGLFVGSRVTSAMLRLHSSNSSSE